MITRLTCLSFVFLLAALSSFGQYKGGSGSGTGKNCKANYPLPVELLFFTATLQNDSEVLLHWQTSSETNNDYFIVEKSDSTMNWLPFAVVDGKGNSNVISNYELNDENPVAGKNYYRLTQTDYDGTKTYLKMAVVNVEISNMFSVYPIPSNGEFTVSADGIVSKTIVIVDMQGKLAEYIAQPISENQIKITIVNPVSGFYALRVCSDSKCNSKNLIFIDK